jgi:membrane associated rhomboid family serine protease
MSIPPEQSTPTHQATEYVPVDPKLSGFRLLSVTSLLIVLNVLCFVGDSLTTHDLAFANGMHARIAQPFYEIGAFTIETAIFHLQLWRFITFQFLHANYVHLAFNMMALFFFGPLVESYLGSLPYLAFYLLCGIAGPMSYVLLYLFHMVCYGPHLAAAERYSGLIGASAGVFGILIAAAQVLPDATVLVYGVFPARLRTVAWVLLGIAIYTVFTNGRNAGGEAAHLGGAALGYLLIKGELRRQNA